MFHRKIEVESFQIVCCQVGQMVFKVKFEETTHQSGKLLCDFVARCGSLLLRIRTYFLGLVVKLRGCPQMLKWRPCLASLEDSGLLCTNFLRGGSILLVVHFLLANA